MPPKPPQAVALARRMTRSVTRDISGVVVAPNGTGTGTVDETAESVPKRRKVAKAKEAPDVDMDMELELELEMEMELQPTAKAKTTKTTPKTAAPKKATPKTTPKKPTAKAKAEPSTPSRPRLPSTPPPPMDLPAAMAHLATCDARFGPLFARIPCRPFSAPTPEHIDPFRTLVTSIIGQQVSWMAARSITRRFVELFCGAVEAERYDDAGPFPSCAQVAKAEVGALKGVGCSTRKAEYLIALAQHFQDGTLTPSLLLTGSDSQVADALIAVRGIGRWTVDMFLIFTLRRPDVLPVGDLGVQKGLLRWVLAAHGALPPSVPKSPKTPKGKGKGKEDHTPSDYGGGGVTLTPSASMATIPATPTPSASPLAATASFTTATPPWNLVTPTKLTSTPSFETPLPSTPAPPALTPSASTLLPAPVPTPSKLPAPAPDSILTPPPGWDKDCAHRAAPLPDGLSVEMLRSRLAGKKAKGGVYLLPGEMEALTEPWRPFRSVGTYYTWSMAGET